MKTASTPIVPMREIKQRVIGLELLRILSENGQRIFSTDYFLQHAGAKVSHKDALASLNLLVEEGWLIILRRGTYALINAIPPHRPAHPFEIAATLVTPAAFSHWTALQHYGLSPEPSPYLFVLTHTAPSLPRYRRKDSAHPKEIYPVGSYLFRFVQIQPIRFFGVTSVLDQEATIQITDLERTLWDAVSMPQLCGGWLNIESGFYAAKDRLDVDRLISYAIKGDAATAKRLGWLLEYQGKSANTLQPLLELPVKGMRLLDPSGPSGGFCNQRWKIQVNTIL